MSEGMIEAEVVEVKTLAGATATTLRNKAAS